MPAKQRWRIADLSPVLWLSLYLLYWAIIWRTVGFGFLGPFQTQTAPNYPQIRCWGFFHLWKPSHMLKVWVKCTCYVFIMCFGTWTLAFLLIFQGVSWDPDLHQLFIPLSQKKRALLKPFIWLIYPSNLKILLFFPNAPSHPCSLALINNSQVTMRNFIGV